MALTLLHAGPHSLPVDGGRRGVRALGVWVLRLQKASSPTGSPGLIPLLVLVDPGAGAVRMTAPGLEAWRPYREALPADEVLRIMRPDAGPKLDADDSAPAPVDF